MKMGDLVKLKAVEDSRAGLIVEFVEKKCWRTDVFGNKVDWGKIEPEPHAVVLFRNDRLSIPVIDLELIDEGR